MKDFNKVMLITYADSMGKDLHELDTAVSEYFSGAIGGMHILPFYPSSGDRGFSPITYEEVEPAFGTWSDIESLSKRYFMMADFMINHISRRSEYFRDFEEKKDESEYRDFFIRFRDFWPNGEPTEEDLAKMIHRHPGVPAVEVTFRDGTKEKLWCTFSPEQIDLNIHSAKAREYITKSVDGIIRHGISAIRLDAMAFVDKKPGTDCFFLEPDIWKSLKFADETISSRDAVSLVEIHTNYERQLKVAETGVYVYDFVLPLLVLHTLYTGSSAALKNWLRVCPHNQFTVLDTHDGIGISDAEGILSPEEIRAAKDMIFEKSGVDHKYSFVEDYQVNCTYYAALGSNDRAYLLARAIQFFTPGIPQVYYVGLLAGENDVAKGRDGRDVNRHNYSLAEIADRAKSSVVERLTALMTFRNVCTAFDGEISVDNGSEDSMLNISWKNGDTEATLTADLKSCRFSVTCSNAEEQTAALLKKINQE